MEFYDVEEVGRVPGKYVFSRGTGTPLVVVPGWGSSLGQYRPLLDTLCTTGQPVLYIPSLRRGGGLDTYHLAEIPKPVNRQAYHINDTLKEAGLTDATILAFSGGTPGALLAASYTNPCLIKRAVMMGGATICATNPFQLTQRLLAKGMADIRDGRNHPDPIVRALGRRAIRDMLAYAGPNPVRAISEGWAYGRFSSIQLMQMLVEQVVGFGIDFVTGSGDILFPPAEVEAVAARISPQCRVRTIRGATHDLQRFPLEVLNVLIQLGLVPTPHVSTPEGAA